MSHGIIKTMSAKNIIGGTFEDIGEAIVKPVVDQVGQALEQGGKSVLYSPVLQPTQPQKAQTPAQDEAKKQEIRWQINRFKNVADAQNQVRQAKKQQQAEANQAENQKKEIKQFDIVKKQNKNIALEQATKKTEAKGGLGG